MARTLTALPGPFVVGGKWGFNRAEEARQNFDVLAYLGDHLPLGGAPHVGYVTGAATWEAVDPTKTIALDGEQLGGMTLEALVWVWTENAAQAVQARVRNTSDNSNAALGTSSTSTTPVLETLALTLAAGAKSYRLEVLGGADHAVFAAAVIRIRKVPV